MKAVISLEKELIEDIKAEIRDGGFTSANDFINHAIREYLRMKNGTPDDRAPDIDDVFIIEENNVVTHQSKSYSASIDSGKRESSKQISKISSIANMMEAEETSFLASRLHMMSEQAYAELLDEYNFKLTNDDLKAIKDIELDAKSHIQPIHNQNSMLFGQINRFFAVKSALYIVAYALKKKGFHPLSDKDKKHCGDIAAFFSLLVQYVKERSDKKILTSNIAVSLPKLSIDKIQLDKSLNRFMAQYLWNIRRGDKKVDGILAKLGFITVVKQRGDFKIHITNEGVEFLKINNPVIDYLMPPHKHNNKTINMLSKEEIAFLLKHIKKTIPNEHKAIILILSLIDRRLNTPAQLEVELEHEKDIFGDKSMMRDMNRNGILARLSEMKLIDRVRLPNSRVTYILTSEGNAYLSKEKETK